MPTNNDAHLGGLEDAAQRDDGGTLNNGGNQRTYLGTLNRIHSDGYIGAFFLNRVSVQHSRFHCGVAAMVRLQRRASG